MQGETRFKAKVKRELDKLVPDVKYTKIQQVVKKGDPDFILCCVGDYIEWELKVGDNEATNLQQYKLDKTTKAGGVARVVYPENLEECMEELRCLIRQSKR